MRGTTRCGGGVHAAIAGCALAALLARAAAAQAPQVAPGIPAAAERHIEAARATGDAEWSAVVTAVCNSAVALANPPQARGAGAGRGGAGAGRGGPRATPARETWAVEPHKVFDNLYSSGRPSTRPGRSRPRGHHRARHHLRLLGQGRSRGGMKKLGLESGGIKYVVVSHGHGDHRAAPSTCRNTSAPG